MSHRYAVLWETSPEEPARPAGLVVEQDDHVLVEAPDAMCLAPVYSEPFVVRGPDMTVIQYTPKDSQYFDQVLLDLSRTFVIGNEGRVNQATPGVILRLLAHHIFAPLRSKHVVVYYDTARTYPSVQEYQRTYYHDEPSSCDTDDQERQEVGSDFGLYVAA